MKPRFVTIGVYGFDETSFFQALEAAKVDTFCDIRWRRGVRGAEYAFANSQRLQRRLAEMGIHYLHRRDLAPTPAVRRRQSEADKASKTPRRQRASLSPAFVNAYRTEILAHFDPQSLLDDLPPDSQVVALFCVEREPAACHRSLLAEKLARESGITVEHIVP